jgi:hypothetical protein
MAPIERSYGFVKRPLLGETWNRWKDYADHLEAEVERLRAENIKLSEGSFDLLDEAHAEIERLREALALLTRAPDPWCGIARGALRDG